MASLALHLLILTAVVALTRPSVPPSAVDEPPVEVVFEAAEQPPATEPAAEKPAEPTQPSEPPQPPPKPPEIPPEPPQPAPEPPQIPPEPPPRPAPPRPEPSEPSPTRPPPVIRPPVVSRPPRPKPSQPAAIPRQEETRPGSPVASSLKANPPPTAPPSIDASWQASVAGWLASHKTYPEDARRDGEQGRVSIRFTIDRSGRVLEASIVSASGYALLDSAAMALVRGASFPSFPASMPQERITITTSIRYTLQ